MVWRVCEGSGSWDRPQSMDWRPLCCAVSSRLMDSFNAPNVPDRCLKIVTVVCGMEKRFRPEAVGIDLA